MLLSEATLILKAVAVPIMGLVLLGYRVAGTLSGLDVFPRADRAGRSQMSSQLPRLFLQLRFQPVQPGLKLTAVASTKTWLFSLSVLA